MAQRVLALILLMMAHPAQGQEASANSALPRFEPVRRPANGRTVREAPLPKSRAWDTTDFPARMIYLNGVNISSVRNQELQGVDLRVDEAGNIHITAPHYDVSTDASYHPLLPGELPRFPKAPASPEGAPSGRYSKGTGERSNLVPSPPDRTTVVPPPADESAEGGTAPEAAPRAREPQKAPPRPPKAEPRPEAPREQPLSPDTGFGGGQQAPQPARALDGQRSAPVVPVVPAPEIPQDLQGGANL